MSSKTVPQAAQNSAIIDYQVEKLNELKQIYKQKHSFSEDELHTLKLIVKDLSLFKEVQPNIRNDILLFFDVVELKQNEILLKKEAPGSSVYILVSGNLKKSIHAPWNSYKEEEDKAELDLISLRESFSSYSGFKVFGDFDILNLEKCQFAADKWKPCFIYALTPSVVFVLNYDKTIKYMEKLLTQQQFLEKSNFLTKTVPGLEHMLTSNKDKIIQLFETVKFLPGQVIVKEGTQPSHCHIIIDGQCSLSSSQIPVHLNMLEEDPRKAGLFTASNKGYFSQTMNSFQLGIIDNCEWIGEEMLSMPYNEKLQHHANLHVQEAPQIHHAPNHHQEPELTLNEVRTKLSSTQTSFVDSACSTSRGAGFQQQANQQQIKQPKQQQQHYPPLIVAKKPQQKQKLVPGTYLNYSVVAKSEVTTYCISREDLVQKCPKDVQNLITKQGKKKQQWIEKRYKDIQANIMKIFNMEHTNNEQFEKSKEVNKRYPQASKNALKVIGDLHLRKSSIDAQIDTTGDLNNKSSTEKSFITSQSIKFGGLQKSFSQQQMLTLLPKKTIEMRFEQVIGGGTIKNLKHVLSPVDEELNNRSTDAVNVNVSGFNHNNNSTSFLPDISMNSPTHSHQQQQQFQQQSFMNRQQSLESITKPPHVLKSESLAKLSSIIYSPTKRNFSLSQLDQTNDSCTSQQLREGLSEKLMMGAASSYKFTKDNKLCLPTLIKNIEADKVTKMMYSKTKKFNYLDQQSKQDQTLNDVMSSKFKEAHFGEKKIRFMKELLSPVKRGSVFYGNK